MPSKGNKKGQAGRDPVTGRFVKGYGGGGRPVKPDWLKGKGIEALKYAYIVLLDDAEKTDLRLQAARMLAEYDLGKPRQQLDIDTDAVPQVVIIGDVLD